MSQSEFLAWCDHLKVEIRAVPDQMSPPSEVWRVVIDDPNLDRDDVATALLDARDEAVSGDGFYLDEKRSYTSWGADAAVAEAILTVAEWAVEAGVGTIAVTAFGKIWRRVRERSENVTPDVPLERQEAEARVRWTLSETYEVDPDSLRLVAESHESEGNRWDFSYEHEGQMFDGTIDGATSELPEMSHVRRCYAPTEGATHQPKVRSQLGRCQDASDEG